MMKNGKVCKKRGRGNIAMSILDKIRDKKHKPYITKEGYKQVYRPKDPDARPNGYTPEHRYIARKKYGNELTSDLIIHHVDGNKLNNDIDNLKMVTPKEHYKIHNSKKRK